MRNDAPVTVTVASALAAPEQPHQSMPGAFSFTHWSSGPGNYTNDPDCPACQDVARDRTLLRLLAAAAREYMEAVPGGLVDTTEIIERMEAAEARLAALLGPAPGDGDGG